MFPKAPSLIIKLDVNLKTLIALTLIVVFSEYWFTFGPVILFRFDFSISFSL